MNALTRPRRNVSSINNDGIGSKYGTTDTTTTDKERRNIDQEEAFHMLRRAAYFLMFPLLLCCIIIIYRYTILIVQVAEFLYTILLTTIVL